MLVSMPAWIKGLYSKIGFLGWLVLLFNPLRYGFQMASEVDYFSASLPSVARFLDSGLGFVTTFLVGCLILGYAIYRSKNPLSGNQLGSPLGPMKAPPSPHNSGGGSASPVMTAGDNSQIHYYSVVNNIDNRTTIYILPRDRQLSTENAPIDSVATVKVDLRTMKLLNSFNVSSITDEGRNSLSVQFADPLNPTNVQSHSLSASTSAALVTASAAKISFDESKTDIIEVLWRKYALAESDGPESRKAEEAVEHDEAAFRLGYDRTHFKTTPGRGAAVLRLTQLRGEGVVIRNDGSTLIFSSDLNTWASRVDGWMKEVIEALTRVSATDSEWFRTLGEVPPARVPIPNVQLGGMTDREIFASIFRQHDYRLARLDGLLKKYGVGA